MQNVLKRLSRKIFFWGDRLGIHILPKHYYTPIPDYSWLRAHREAWTQRAPLLGVEWNLDEQLRWLEEICRPYYHEVAGLEFYRRLSGGEWGPGFGPIESQVLHCFVRSKNPPRILEVGSGVSTACMAHAGKLNQKEGRGMPAVTSIEPFPRPALREMKEVTHVRQVCQTAPMELFERLQAGDLLFIDSSHAVKLGSDVIHLYLNVIPRLAPGVFIHIHDIVLPYLYGPDVLEKYFAWQETTLLLALLTDNRRLTIRSCLSALHHDRKEELRSLLADYRPQMLDHGLSAPKQRDLHFPASMWLQSA
ncbi:MAG: class I SAM-dependent methyltransferase [Candidatus Acidiferrales bacterium]